MRSAYAIANEKVDITDVCRLIGMDVASFGISMSPKLYCPFGHVSHSDAGASKAFRVYGDTNSAHCFACGKTWGPVALYAENEDLNWQEAADALLDHFEIPRENADDRWADLTKEKEFTVNTAELAESLKLYCQRICPDWESRQFEPNVSYLYGTVLNLLSLIRSMEDVDRWRMAAKQVMKNELDKVPTGP